MVDSFADLWASSAPTKPIQPPQKLGAAPPTQQSITSYPRRPQQDAFSILSATQSSTTRTLSPQIANQTQPQQSSTQALLKSSNAAAGDAFSGLFIASTGSSLASTGSMTMAERAALAQKAKAQKSYSVKSGSSAPTSSAWAGLDALAQPTSNVAASSTTDDFDFAFDSVPTTSNSPLNNNSINNDDWGLSEFSSPPPVIQSNSPFTAAPITKSASASASASASKPQTLWDLDEFASPSHQQPSCSHTGTPRDFDFGDREDGLLGGDDSEAKNACGLRASSSGANTHEDDILGDLGKPVLHSPSPNPVPSTRRLPRGTNSSSPPPHITGQLVEMGFSPQDANAALSSTKTEIGFDVQAAAELLLSQGGGADEEGSERPSPDLRERERDRGACTQGTTRPPPARSDSQQHTSTPGSSQSHSQAPGQTADKLLSQASEIGRGVFSKANALWKEGRERAAKIYEERASTVAGGSSAAMDARPKWMREGGARDGERAREMEGVSAVRGGFRDDGDNDRQGREKRERERLAPAAPPHRSPQPPPPQPQTQDIDLFNNADAPPTYQSPFRRAKPKTQPTLTSEATSSQASTSTPPATHPSPPNSNSSPTPPRNLTSTIQASTLVTSTSHKSTGTQAYKLGDFPTSVASYALALSALPPHHVLRVPILTNMALVKGKVGDLKEVANDCEEAVRIIRGFVAVGGGGLMERDSLSSDSHSTLIPASVLGMGKVQISIVGGGPPANTDPPTSVDLIEGLTKAYRRRAEAYEGLEKWDMARTDWEVLISAEWAGAGAKGEALRGVGRCRRMIEGGSAGGGGPSRPAPPKPTSTTTSKPRPKPTPSTPTSLAGPASSAALAALRASHSTQASEDALRLTHKDAVDARLAAWRAGKEANIRALLTTLDSVLWPELGWRRVGMAEVVGAGQVKGAYVRAIARVHPDKLNATNTTVEQRMIANGVFGALNEAWNAFQQQS
ncbi:hypothetical protein BS17DRAFT_818174 [Gyrodon lividus]|nr:hypothetical protein BS17DRAFT_818174 [Gyrodon lividus]